MQFPDTVLDEARNPLCCFGGKRVDILGKVKLLVSLCYVGNLRTERITFDVVELEYPYNAILGRGTLNTLEAATHSAYLCMKIPGPRGVLSVFESQNNARRVENNFFQGYQTVTKIEADEGHAEPEKEKIVAEKAGSTEQPKQVVLDEDFPDQKVLIGTQLEETEQTNLVDFLKKNHDVFTWSAKDLCGVSRSIIEHALNVDPTVKPKKQKQRKMSKDRAEGAKAEVNRLLEASVIRPIKDP